MGVLAGITRPRPNDNGMTRSAIRNPDSGWHSPLGMQNRVRMQLVGPNEHGDIVTKQTIEREGNLMASFGLNKLCEILATSVAYNSSNNNWISAMRIGTHTQAAATNHDTLGASTAVINMTQDSDATMRVSDAGERTLRYLGTFESDNPAGGGITIEEIGLFCNSTGHNEMASRLVLGTDMVNKGASDVINVSYDILITSG